jgi:hypothetical protein
MKKSGKNKTREYNRVFLRSYLLFPALRRDPRTRREKRNRQVQSYHSQVKLNVTEVNCQAKTNVLNVSRDAEVLEELL